MVFRIQERIQNERLKFGTMTLWIPLARSDNHTILNAGFRLLNSHKKLPRYPAWHSVKEIRSSPVDSRTT